MIKRVFSVILIFCIQSAVAQDVESCEAVILKVYKAIDDKDASSIYDDLADDFEIQGFTGEMAKMILNQLFVQLDSKVTNINKISSKKEGYLTLVYGAEFSYGEIHKSTFVFNDQNKLKELHLLEMQIQAIDNTKEKTLEKTDQKVFSMPFELVENLIVVNAELNGESKDFILDSGSPEFILNRTSKNTPGESSAQGAGGSINGMGIEKVESFSMGGVFMKEQEVLTIDISHLERETGMKIEGLIGYELIKDFDVLIDYMNKELVFINPVETENYISKQYDSVNKTLVDFELSAHIPVLNIKIGKNDYSFGIDTGASTNLMEESLLNDIRKSIRNMVSDTLVGANKNSTVTLSGEIKKLTINDKKYKRVLTMFSDISHLNNGYGLNIDGLIGYEILSKQVSIICFQKGKLVLLDQ